MVGYATIYTMAPVFSLVLDRDLNEDLALSYPELYNELIKVRACLFPQLLVLVYAHIVNAHEGWPCLFLGTSLMLQDSLYLVHDFVYQRASIMIIALVLFENKFLNIVAISFTALTVNELIMVALEITKLHVLSQPTMKF